MNPLEAQRQHIEANVLAVLQQLPPNVTLDNVPKHPTVQVEFQLRSGVGADREVAYGSADVVFGRVSFFLRLDHVDGKSQGEEIRAVVSSLRDRLKATGYKRIAITKRLSGFVTKPATYTNAEFRLSFYAHLVTHFQYQISWFSSLTPLYQ
jgi:hypothetical protein